MFEKITRNRQLSGANQFFETKDQLTQNFREYFRYWLSNNCSHVQVKIKCYDLIKQFEKQSFKECLFHSY